jgi:hypothetical protein
MLPREFSLSQVVHFVVQPAHVIVMPRPFRTVLSPVFSTPIKLLAARVVPLAHVALSVLEPSLS